MVQCNFNHSFVLNHFPLFCYIHMRTLSLSSWCGSTMSKMRGARLKGSLWSERRWRPMVVRSTACLQLLAGGEHTGSVMISDMIGQRNSSAQSSRSRSSATCNFSATARR